jgi:formyltetrahydrofolate hydrolase
MKTCCGEDFLIFDRKKLVSFLECSSVRNFYSKNSSMKEYERFLKETKDTLLSRIHIQFYGNYNDLAQFKLAFNNTPENFDKIKKYNLEFEIMMVMTSPDDNYFYKLLYSQEDKKCRFVKLPVVKPNLET